MAAPRNTTSKQDASTEVALAGASAPDAPIVTPEEEPKGSPGSREDKEGNVRHPVDYLARNARALLGETDTVVIGALSGEDRKTFSAPEASEIIKKYLSRPVDLDGNTTADDGDQE